MSDSLRLSVPDLSDEVVAAEFYRVADAAREHDGYDPFNEQSRFDLAAGKRTAIVATLWSQGEHTRAIGAAVLGRGELDFVIDPVFRGAGYGEIALRGLLPTAQGDITAWSHGDHPAARILAERHGFTPVRRLLQLRATLRHAQGTGAQETGITAFNPSSDAEPWVKLNAQIFRGHPEQGAVTLADLHERMAEPWFDAGDFLVARDESGHMIGYNWLKIEPGSAEGEIYVIGVDAGSAGRGLGRALMQAGLMRLRERGCSTAGLYVEADNEAAVHLYRSLGFDDHTIDVQYRRG